MRTFERVCIEDYRLEAKNGDVLQLKRGQIYLTSEEHHGVVTVFTRFWVPVPVRLFAGERVFTEQ